MKHGALLVCALGTACGSPSLGNGTVVCGTAPDICPPDLVCACGHCMDPASSASCEPAVLSTTADELVALAVAGGNLYFATTSALYTCPRSGCGATPTLLTTPGLLIKDIAANASNLYWTHQSPSGGVISTCEVSGCSPVALATGQSLDGDLAIDVVNAYWTNVDRVRKCARTGCNNSPTTLETVTSPPPPEHVISDGTYVYWSWSTTNGGLMRCASAGCGTTRTTLAQVTNVNGIATDGTEVYFTISDRVLTCAATGCGGSPRMVAIEQSNAFSIAVDATSVYWTNYRSEGDLVMKCPRAGCSSPIPVAWMQKNAREIAVDETSIYWIADDPVAGSSVMKIAK